MNILILNWRSPFDPKAGGAEKVTLKHAQYWAGKGNSVTWLHAKHKQRHKQETINDKHTIRFISLGSPFTVYCLAPLWYWIINKEQFDVVVDEIHGMAFCAPLWARPPIRRTGPPIRRVAFIHEVAQEIWDDMTPWPLSAVGKWWEKFYLKHIYKNTPFVTVSRSTYYDLVTCQVTKKNITIAPNGFTLPTNTPIAKNKQLTLVFVGRLVKMKGIRDAIQVMQRIKNNELGIKGVHLHIIGEGDEKGVNSDTITYHGFVSEKQKQKLMAQAHFLIHPSTREGFGLVVLEANAVGTPSIGYDVAGLRDVIRPGINGYLVEKGNVEKMADTIVKTIHDTQTYNALCSTSREEVKKYSWEKSLKIFYSLISGE